MGDTFKGAIERLVAAAQAAYQQAGDATAARSSLAAAARELASAIEALPAGNGSAGEPKAETRVEPKAEPKAEPKVEPKAEAKGGRPEEGFFREAAELGKRFRSSSAAYDPADFDKLIQGPEILKGFSEADRAGEKMTKFLAAIVGVLDGLIAHGRFVAETELRGAAKELRGKALGLLALRGVAAEEGKGDAVEIRSRGAKGSTVALLRTGFGGGPARLLVSSGDGNEVSDAIEEAARAVGAGEASSSEEKAERAGVIKKLEKLLGELAGKSGDFETTMARYAVNEVQGLEGRMEPWPGKGLLQLLKSRGVFEIGVTLGQVFDESYSPGKYERRKVAVPGAARNSIVKVVQRGFTNQQGICIQKCVLAVASGD